MKNVANVVMVLTGTFIGAGFASGKEIWQYFGVFGNLGIYGMAISCLLLGLFTYCTADNVVWLGERNYVKSIYRYRWVKWFLNSYMLVIFCTMITAFGESVEQSFGFPKIYGVILMDVVAIIILYFGTEGLVKLSVVVTPLIIFGIICVFLTNSSLEVFSKNNFVTSSVVYTSYNVVSLPFVLSGIKKSLSDKKTMLLCSVVFATIIFSLGVCILKILEGVNTMCSIPLLNAVATKYTFVFVLVLAMSMLTTAVSNGYGIVNGIGINKNITISFLGIFSLLFSFLKFGFIIKYMYGFYGYMGLYILIINFYVFLKNREKTRKLKKITNNHM